MIICAGVTDIIESKSSIKALTAWLPFPHVMWDGFPPYCSTGGMPEIGDHG